MLSQINLVHALASHVFKICFNIILSTSVSSELFLSLKLPQPKRCMHFCPLPPYVPHALRIPFCECCVLRRLITNFLGAPSVHVSHNLRSSASARPQIVVCWSSCCSLAGGMHFLTFADIL
jgi:hypothetical protein